MKMLLGVVVLVCAALTAAIFGPITEIRVESIVVGDLLLAENSSGE